MAGGAPRGFGTWALALQLTVRSVRPNQTAALESGLMKWKKPRQPLAGSSTPPVPPVPQKEGPYDLIRALGDEIGHIGKLQKKNNSAFVQRLLVRQFVSSLDAYAFYFQDRARESAESEGVVFTDEETSALHLRPEDTDADRLKPAFQQIAKNLLFAIKIFAKVRGVEPVCTELPPVVPAAIRIRNRLTHPKKASDLNLSAGELKIVASAIQWLQEMASWGSREEVAYIDRVRQRVHASIEKQKQEIMARVNQSAPEAS